MCGLSFLFPGFADLLNSTLTVPIGDVPKLIGLERDEHTFQAPAVSRRIVRKEFNSSDPNGIAFEASKSVHQGSAFIAFPHVDEVMLPASTCELIDNFLAFDADEGGSAANGWTELLSNCLPRDVSQMGLRGMLRMLTIRVVRNRAALPLDQQRCMGLELTSL